MVLLLSSWLVPPVLLLVALFATACASEGPQPDDGVRVVTSLEIFADLVRNVGGERVAVTALLPSGADPHTYEPTARQVTDIARADVAFVNGLGLEGSVLGVIEEHAGGPVVELAQGLETLDDNPHLWLDVGNAARYVERIRDALIGRDEAGRSAYETNAEAYLAELGALDREVQEAVASIPPESRKLVTFHDAFAYLAERYGLEVVAVVASPGQAPNARQVARLTETLESEGIRAAFKEPQLNADVLELAAGDAGVPLLDLLSDAYTEGVGSYLELMRFNANQLVEGLGDD